MTQLKLNLYENAVDSITHAIEHYTSDPVEERRYKYAILHLSQGVTLLLKERLSLEHPNFIYKNVAKPEGGTVDVSMAISRLKEITGTDLGQAERALMELASLRNDIEHYEVNLTKQQADSIIGRIVPFLVSFISDELSRNFQREENTWKSLLTIQGYHLNAIKTAKQMIQDKSALGILCPKCQEVTAIKIEEHWNDLSTYKVQCLACLEVIEIGVRCQECRREQQLSIGQTPCHHSYCSDCTREIINEFQITPTDRALFAAEVRRWFQTNDSITFNQMMRLVRNVSTAMSSMHSFAFRILDEGLIDFQYDDEKKINEAIKNSGANSIFGRVHGGDRFVWIWNPR